MLDMEVKKEPLESASGVFAFQGTRSDFVAGCGTLPLLHIENEVEVAVLEASDIYVCDQDSWHSINNLLNLIQDDNIEYCSGLTSGCVLLFNKKCRYAWTLHKCKSLHNAFETCSVCGDLTGFRWFYISQKCRNLINAYVLCQNLNMAICQCVLIAKVTTECATTSQTHVQVNMVMKSERDLEFYTHICLHLPYDDMLDNVKCGNNVYRMPNFYEHPLLISPCPLMIDESTNERFSELDDKTELYSFINRIPHSEEDFSLVVSPATCVVEDVDLIVETNMKCCKTDVEEDGGQVLTHDNAQQLEQKTSKRTSNMKVWDYEKLVGVAETYASIFSRRGSDNFSSLCLPAKIRGPMVVIECPKCNIPCTCSSPSAFLKLLRHMSRRHTDSLRTLLADITYRYKSYIDHMKRKIQCRNKKRYSMKLRKLKGRAVRHAV